MTDRDYRGPDYGRYLDHGDESYPNRIYLAWSWHQDGYAMLIGVYTTHEAADSAAYWEAVALGVNDDPDHGTGSIESIVPPVQADGGVKVKWYSGDGNAWFTWVESTEVEA